MRVNFYATLRPLAGAKVIEVEITPPVRVLDVLESATKSKPDLAAAMWQSPGILKGHIKIFLNGRQTVHLPQELETLVQANDSLDVFPPVGGGA